MSELRIDEIGEEGQPVICVEEAFPDPQQLIELAAAESFDLEGAYYPGIRAPAPREYAQIVQEAVAAVGPEAFGWQGGRLAVHECYFSLVTIAPEDLMPIQRMPHYDSTDPGTIAVLHYLCNESHGGTAFYRHRSTGFESLSDVRHETYRAALEQDVQREGVPPADYTRGSGPIFEQTASYEARFNRLIAYRGVTLHSGMIPENPVLSENPREGRLTLNTFLRHEA